MLSVTRFQKINGHVPLVSRDPHTGQWQAQCECACGRLPATMATGWYESETSALESLRDMVLSHHGLAVVENQNWQCAECGKVGPLSVHHRVFRSHGRNDRVENLIALDLPCHERRHGRKA